MITDKIYFYYFLIHTPITILVDATFAIPIEYQISIQRKLHEFHVTTNKDFLGENSPLWMKIFVIWELIFQLPFFIYGVYDYLKNNQKHYSIHTWPMFLLYGFNAGFTTLICLIYVLLDGDQHGLNTSEWLNLLGLYTPTMILPFFMMYDFWIRIINQLKLTTKQKNN
jgi:hypothetical protein